MKDKYKEIFDKGTDFISGECLRLDLNSLGGAQTEAIVFDENEALFISTEETNKAHAIYEIEWRKWADKLKSFEKSSCYF